MIGRATTFPSSLTTNSKLETLFSIIHSITAFEKLASRLVIFRPYGVEVLLLLLPTTTIDLPMDSIAVGALLLLLLGLPEVLGGVRQFPCQSLDSILSDE